MAPYRADLKKVIGTVIKWCICIIIFAVPFSKSLGEIAIAVAITLWVVKKLVTRDFRVRHTDINIPLLIFAIAAVPSLLNSAYLTLSVKALFTKVLKYVFLCFVIVDEIDTKDKLRDLFYMGLLAAVVIMTDGFIQYAYGIDMLHDYPAFKMRVAYDLEGFFRGFPTASFPFPNDFASWLLLTLVPLICVTIFDLRGKTARYLMALVSAGLSYLFFLTKARGAWFALAISMIYIALSKDRIWIIVVLIIMLLIPFVMKMEMAKYIFGFSSVEHRFKMWQTGWEIFKQHPIIGNGLNTFFEKFRMHRSDKDKGKRGSYAHNCYLQMAADVGIIGLGAFLWVIAAHFISMTKRLRRMTDPFYGSILWGMSIGIFAFLVHAFFDTNLYSLNLTILFWTWIGISQSIGLVCGEGNS